VNYVLQLSYKMTYIKTVCHAWITVLCNVGASCAAGDLQLNSVCYRKFHDSYSSTWFNASNKCLSGGGSLAAFANLRRPSDNHQLILWLSTDKIYWIGLIRPWWKTTSEGDLRFYITFDTAVDYFNSILKSMYYTTGLFMNDITQPRYNLRQRYHTNNWFRIR